MLLPTPLSNPMLQVKPRPVPTVDAAEAAAAQTSTNGERHCCFVVHSQSTVDKCELCVRCTCYMSMKQGAGSSLNSRFVLCCCSNPRYVDVVWLAADGRLDSSTVLTLLSLYCRLCPYCNMVCPADAHLAG